MFGLIPALRASRPDLVPALKDASASGKRRRVELRDVLVVVQVAVSLVLVVGGALLVRSLSAAARVNLGYDADRTAYLSLALEMTGYDAARAGRFLEDGVQRLRALPQVASGRADEPAPTLAQQQRLLRLHRRTAAAGERQSAEHRRRVRGRAVFRRARASRCWRAAASSPPIATRSVELQ